jgi:fatty-acyl-CoA synthase
MDHAPLSMNPMRGLVQYPEVPIVSCVGEGVFCYTYRQAAERARRLASSLVRLGVGLDDFVGSLAFTTHRHFELMYAAPGIGAVLHTANPRLSAEHITYTVNHAGERLLFVDPECIGLVRDLMPKLEHVDTIVLMANRSDVPGLGAARVLFYEELIAEGTSDFVWPSFDERAGSTLCFTSGTTGDPKGVLYSHRGTLLSSLVIAAPNVWGVSRQDAIIALAPFFHCNGWGSPYLGPMAGAKLILPGRMLDGRSVRELIVAEGATVGPAVPTVWMGVVEHCRQAGVDLGPLERIICGGAAPPLELMRTLWREFHVRTIQVWGMTETTHAATVQWTDEAILSGLAEPSAPQGQPVFGSQIRILSDERVPLPKDGNAVGHLQVKGHWCASAYLGRQDVTLNDAEGWLATGDLAAIASNNALRITDRFKDVIKSGGE